MKLLTLLILVSASLCGQILPLGASTVVYSSAPPAFVQATSKDEPGIASTVSTDAISTTSGHLLYVFVRMGQSSDCSMESATITDTAMNSFTQIGTNVSDGAGSCSAVYYAKNITGNGSDVVQLAWTNSANYNCINVLEFSGLSASSPLDTTAASTRSTSSQISDAFTTGTANEVLVMGGQWRALVNTFTADTGYTIPSGATSTTGVSTVQYKIVSSTQSSVTATLSSNLNVPSSASVATFK